VNNLQRPIQIPADFVMYAYAVGARLDENRSVRVGVFDHQVMVEFELCEAAQRFGNGRTHREIGHKMAVHDVYVEHLHSSRLNTPDILTQPDKIRSENGGNDLNHDYSSRPSFQLSANDCLGWASVKRNTDAQTCLECPLLVLNTIGNLSILSRINACHCNRAA
jgi:hypothetical protein